ncbi:hypothetical protein [Tannerella forsythia]|uniref:Lipoprotein n=1 Tax=Tannerella forsythia TaxID=28112 RepID=A0A3P1YW38_TANFO|nr:hypothetical protein [Tannerella forsythia]RRD73986.1 hypothetical protein EII41_08655 [Tannerella forsythia]
MKTYRFYASLLCATVILAGMTSCDKERLGGKDELDGGNGNGLTYKIGECEMNGNTATIHFEIFNNKPTDEEISFENVYSQEYSWIYDDWGNRYAKMENVYIRIGEVESNDYTVRTVLPKKKKIKGMIKIREVSTQASALNFKMHTNQGFDLKKTNLQIPDRVPSLPENKLNLVKSVAGFEFTVLSYQIEGTTCTIHYKVKNTNAEMKKLSFEGTTFEKSWLFDDWGNNYEANTTISLGRNVNKYTIAEFVPSDITLYGRLVIRELYVKASSLSFNLAANLSDDIRFDDVKLKERTSSLPVGKATYKEVNVPSDKLECKIIKCSRSGTSVIIDYSIRNKDAGRRKFNFYIGNSSITNQLDEKFSRFSIKAHIGNKTDSYSVSESIPYNVTVYGRIILSDVKEHSKSLNLKLETNYPIPWSIKDLVIE